MYFQISLESTDDTKIVSYHWEEVNGPFQEEKTPADSPTLRLSNLVPGNYTFRQVVPTPLLSFQYISFDCFPKLTPVH